jgi:hypothetical protein
MLFCALYLYYKALIIMSTSAIRPTQAFVELPDQNGFSTDSVESILPESVKYSAQHKSNIFCIEPNSDICQNGQNIQVPRNVFVFIRPWRRE